MVKGGARSSLRCRLSKSVVKAGATEASVWAEVCGQAGSEEWG